MIEKATARNADDRNRISIRLSHYDRGLYDARFRRKIAGRKITPATAEEWAEYERALAMLEELRESPYFEDGGPEERATVDTPRDHITVTYAETEAEWRARCAKITGPPPPGALDAMQGEMKWALGQALDQMGGEITHDNADI